MPTIGVDCDITLQHPDVNGGHPVGFLLATPKMQDLKSYGPAISIQYETLQDAMGDAQDILHAYITILIADNLQNPDGSTHTESAVTMRTYLLEIISKHTGITLTTRTGVHGGLKSLSETINTIVGYQVFPMMDDMIYSEIETLKVHLTTRSSSFAPVNPVVYLDSLWVDESTYAGVRTWNNSYWRSL
ncbi:MAG: hypothetical protein IT308_09440 [Anaerolineaceae bacterium]|nr:hypothetical protein [Anaerolineaceae bacterium]